MIKLLTSKEDYIEHLLKDVPEHRRLSVIQEAYKNALDTRKFEIDLYWKRATYFWTFIAAIFIGFYTIINQNELFKIEIIETSITQQKESIEILVDIMIFGVSLLGYIFSLGWYFVNRGSKVWQENWERHIGFLEDYLNGPLFKTVIKPNLYFTYLNSSYPYSVSKVNQMLSLFVTIFWYIIINALSFILFIDRFKPKCFIVYFLFFVVVNLILVSVTHMFHKETVSFMHKDWEEGNSNGRTYIN
ncbi:hypothetical protein [Epilithonimonas sp.]|uniref:RipA family octameric membrane protein n=1 Tax=Epilithonimonas sp. TaxID=2894511 RepID=UPI00289F7E3D|nr:hypothetical protein [Epilithonimonas sp.]